MSGRTSRDLRAIAFLGLRNILKSYRTPILVVFSVLQPILWLVMFSQTFRGLADNQQFRGLGYQSYLTFLVPGMIVLSVLFTALQSGLATMTDIDTGVLDKYLTSPIRRSSILLGRITADAVTMTIQGAVILVLGLLMGASFREGWTGAIALLALAVLFGITWASLSNLIALRTKNSELTMVVGLFLTLPALFLSSAFFPMPLLPAWLRDVADANPAAYVIQTGQQLMNTGNSWGQDGHTLAAIAIAAVLIIPAAVAAFRASTT